jgi:hypothetical protein
MSSEELKGKLVMGELVRIEAPEEEYTVRYQKLIDKVQNMGA